MSKSKSVLTKTVMYRWCQCENLRQLRQQIDDNAEVTFFRDAGSMFRVKITIKKIKRIPTK